MRGSAQMVGVPMILPVFGEGDRAASGVVKGRASELDA